jgi:tetratricopeptide (TPR) repeat protein
VCNYDGQLQVDVLDGVETLLSNSLLQQREGLATKETSKEIGKEMEAEPRYWMLETIHEYAREMLQESGEAEALQREHALYFMALAEQADPHLTGAKQAEWLDGLEDEHENLRTALRWARERGETEEVSNPQGANGVKAVEVGLRIGGAIWRFWYTRGYFSEGREQLSGALSASAKSILPTPTEQAVPATGSLKARAKALHGAGVLAYAQGDYTSARSLFEESLALRRELGNKVGIASSLAGLGGVVVRSAVPTGNTGNVGDVGKVGSRGPGGAERGARMLGAVEALLETIGAVLDADDRLPYERSVASVRAQLGEEAFKRAWEKGRAMSMEQVIAFALEGTVHG